MKIIVQPPKSFDKDSDDGKKAIEEIQKFTTGKNKCLFLPFGWTLLSATEEEGD